jgi:hypothetical protein
MDHDVDVALWQRGIQHEDDQELGPASSLFDASVIAFSSFLHILATDTTQFESESYQILRNEFRKFYMWNEGFSTRTGDLDHILSSSKNMQGTVLGLMVQWAKAASKSKFDASQIDDMKPIMPRFWKYKWLTMASFSS